MMQAGLDVTLNTDDPSVSRIDLSHEFKLVREDLGVPLDVLKERVLAAANAAFLPDEKREELVGELERDLKL